MLSHLLRNQNYPDELINLYNPGYIGATIYLTGSEYQKKSKSAFPFTYAYVSPALVCADETRERIPARATGRVADWVQANGDVLISFPQRARSLKVFVDSALVFLSARRLLQIDADGCHFRVVKKLQLALLDTPLSSAIVQQELEAAAVLGRLLANEPNTSSVLASLGVKP